jgi:hypothetical protein
MGGRRQNEVCLGSLPSLAAELRVHLYRKRRHLIPIQSCSVKRAPNPRMKSEIQGVIFSGHKRAAQKSGLEAVRFLTSKSYMKNR